MRRLFIFLFFIICSLFFFLYFFFPLLFFSLLLLYVIRSYINAPLTHYHQCLLIIKYSVINNKNQQNIQEESICYTYTNPADKYKTFSYCILLKTRWSYIYNKRRTTSSTQQCVHHWKVNRARYRVNHFGATLLSPFPFRRDAPFCHHRGFEGYYIMLSQNVEAKALQQLLQLNDQSIEAEGKPQSGDREARSSSHEPTYVVIKDDKPIVLKPWGRTPTPSQLLRRSRPQSSLEKWCCDYICLCAF